MKSEIKPINDELCKKCLDWDIFIERDFIKKNFIKKRETELSVDYLLKKKTFEEASKEQEKCEKCYDYRRKKENEDFKKIGIKITKLYKPQLPVKGITWTYLFSPNPEKRF